MRFRRNGERLTFDEFWAIWMGLVPSLAPQLNAIIERKEGRKDAETLFAGIRDQLEAAFIRKGLWHPSGAAASAPAESEDRGMWRALAKLAREVLAAEFGADYAERVAHEFEVEAAAA